MGSLWSFFGPYVVTRRADLIRGSLASIGMVSLRLVLPWPLARIVEPWARAGAEASGIETAWRGGLLFLAIFLGLGLFDYLARVWFARFAVELVADLRASAPPFLKKRRGDHLARMIGDTARFKEGLKGFLIHVATNGLLCIGLLVVLFLLDWSLAAIFGAGLLVIGALAGVFTRQVLGRATKLRRREGRLADTIHESQGSKRAARRSKSGLQVKPSRELPKASLTVIQGRATWVVHVVLAIAVLACLALAGPGGARELSHQELIVFMTYMLHSYHPVVRLGRQLTRVGKLVACARRIQEALQPEPSSSPPQVLGSLGKGLEWREFGLACGNRAGGGMRLQPLTLRLGAGESLAVVGPRGAGKTTLLESVTRRNLTKSCGALLWDDIDLSKVPTKARSKRVGSWKTLARPDELAASGVLVLDDAFDRIPEADRVVQLKRVLGEARGRAVMISMRRAFGLEHFDHVLYLEHGQRVSQKVQT